LGRWVTITWYRAGITSRRTAGLQRRLVLLLLRLDLGRALLQILQRQLQLVLVHRFGALAEGQAAQLGYDVFVARGLRLQSLHLGRESGDLGVLNASQGAECVHIVRQAVQGGVHDQIRA
jgi:hypothetical protein